MAFHDGEEINNVKLDGVFGILAAVRRHQTEVAPVKTNPEEVKAIPPLTRQWVGNLKLWGG